MTKISLSSFSDARGQLTLCTLAKDVGFDVKRVFWVSGVPQGQVRGCHANTEVWELAVCVSGSVDIDVEDSNGAESHHLSSPSEGVLIPPMAWSRQRNFSPGAVLLVLASGDYRPETYINSYDDFKKML